MQDQVNMVNSLVNMADWDPEMMKKMKNVILHQ